MIDSVIFDIDGTLLDSNDVHAHIWHQAFLEFGREVAHSDIRTSIGKGGDNLLPDFLSNEEIAEIGEELKKRRGEIAKPYLDQLKPFTFAHELGNKLKADGKRIAVATSAKEDELKLMLKLVGFETLIELASSSDDAQHSKPDPDIFLAALSRLGNPSPETVLTVGDSPYDVEGAAKAGMKTIGLLCGGFSRESLEKAGAAAIFQSPSDLLLRYDETPFKG
jgi:HAD superfamily hydrolase (TIGR01549 family)